MLQTLQSPRNFAYVCSFWMRIDQNDVSSANFCKHLHLIRPTLKLDSLHYYKYALCYVDNVMIISADPVGIIKELWENFILKEVTDPGKARQQYLGAVIGRYLFNDGSHAWYMLAEEYLS